MRAEIVHGKLAVTVADTGLGFGRAATAGTGVGLNNIRERLQLLYGSKGSMTVAENAAERHRRDDHRALPGPGARRRRGMRRATGSADDRGMSTPARALIADDERLMREQLRARLAEVWPELEIVAEAKNGLEAVRADRVRSTPTSCSSTSACRA